MMSFDLVEHVSVVVAVVMSGFGLMQRTLQRRVYLDKSHLHLVQNRGGITVEFFTAHGRKSTRYTFHLIGQYIVSSVHLKVIAN
jgi:hypothetical protein